jgi:hypothetical protein
VGQRFAAQAPIVLPLPQIFDTVATDRHLQKMLRHHAASFRMPSRGPTSTIRTRNGNKIVMDFSYHRVSRFPSNPLCHLRDFLPQEQR